MKNFKIIGLITMLLSISVLTNQLKAQELEINKVGLSAKEKGIISIASLTATGDLEELKIALNKGLETELTVNEIK